jgi:outer membrane protein assembly factor BamB
MKKISIVLGALMAIILVMAAAQDPSGSDKYWHQWRGPQMNGISANGNPPLEWSESKNVKWKVAIPGRGHSTPIIWENRIFILTAVPLEPEAKPAEKEEEQGGRRGMPSRKTDIKHRFDVLCLDRGDGRVIWQKTVKEEVPQEATHDLGSWASHSPVTDGEYVYAYFGSRGLFCLDAADGSLKWERDFGQMSKRMEFGEGSSPAFYGDKIFILWDHEGDSFLYALDRETGQDVWKAERDEGTSWATPIVIEVDGKHQVITCATKLIRGYGFETGELIWQCGGMTPNAIPTPMVADGILYAMSGFRGNALLAIRLSGAKGDITGTDAIVWSYDGKETSYTPSGLLYGDKLYFLRSNNGILSCFNIKTGEPFYTGERIEGFGNLYTSPVGARDRVYILSQKGAMFVVAHGAEFKLLAKNQLDDSFHSSPAIVDDQMFLRGFENLYCIEEF